MTIHSLCRFGLMTKETTFVLKSAQDGNDFKDIDSKLYEAAMASSRDHASRLLLEIKKRFQVNDVFLPALHDLKLIARSSLSSLVKSQVYFAYLYYADEIVAHVTDKLGDIYSAKIGDPRIDRDDIKGILENYLKATGSNASAKAIRNWVGRYLSIMREVNLLIRKKASEYMLYFLGIQPETWAIFTIAAHFADYPIEKGIFYKAFQVRPAFVPKLLEGMRVVKFVIYKINGENNETSRVSLETSTSSLEQWLEEYA